MKKILMIMMFIGVVFITIFVESYAQNQTKIGEIGSSGQPIFTYDQTKLTNIIDSVFGGGNNIISIQIVNVNSDYFVHALGSKNGQSKLFGFDLSQNGNDLYAPTVVTLHSCTGNNCSSCGFTTTGNTITGCHCASGGGGSCNHTIAQTVLY